MKRKKIPGLFGANNTGPLILLFSPRDRMREILTVGLVQCNYQVVQANTSFLAGIKASQMLPKMVVADLSCENPKDVLLAARIQKSIRTNDIAILLIVPASPDPFVTKVVAELRDQALNDEKTALDTIRYPFAFADLLVKIHSLISPGDDTATPEQAIAADVNRIVAERLFDPAVKTEKKLQDIGAVLNKNWGFPFTVIKALDILESDSGCCTELAKCI
ncbi:MAG: hypothetical protein JXA18_10530, partial [Chitinispirillaceae bacterium]|nr:hypothetical protein [Chitinispirillaceae bacterium]